MLPGFRFQTETKGFPSGGKEHPSRGQTLQGVTIIMNIIHERKVDRTEAAEPNTGIAFAHIHRPFRKQHDPGELQWHCAGDTVRWPFRITGLMKFLGVLLILAALSPTVQAAGVTLAWIPSPDPAVAGYNLYYGGTSGTYTNKVSVGLATSAVTSGLLVGVTYYFAATTYNAAGVESPFSSQVSYTVPAQPQEVEVRTMLAGQFALTVTGTVGHTYDIQATQDFKTWTVIGTVTVGATGLLNFTDTNAASFSRRFYRTRG